jgi:hypothetical protein
LFLEIEQKERDMSYSDWFITHAKKHKQIVDRLIKDDFSSDEIISYFAWDSISKKEIDFCLLFRDGKKCHDIDDLNCYLCACPNFRFDDSIKSGDVSLCSIDSKDGARFTAGGKTHQDCSGCLVPHKEEYIKKQFSSKWLEVMKNCNTR